MAIFEFGPRRESGTRCKVGYEGGNWYLGGGGAYIDFGDDRTPNGHKLVTN